MVNVCIGGGRIEATSGATGRTDLLFRSLDVKGDLNGELTIRELSAKGLIKDLDKALNQVKADQADKVRACLEPVRERLLAILFPSKVAKPQESASSLATPFDGSYAFVSGSKVNETALTSGGRPSLCPNIKPLPSLVIAGGQVRYAPDWAGTIGPEGELVLRPERPLARGSEAAPEITIWGRVDNTGTVHARRRVSGLCDYDVIWEKTAK